MFRLTKLLFVSIVVMIMTISTAYAEKSLAVIWDAPAKWMNKSANVIALETKLKEFLPAVEYSIQSVTTMNEKVAAYRSNHNLLAKNSVEAPPKLTEATILSLGSGNDYVMLIRMIGVISDWDKMGVMPKVYNYYVFDIADLKVYNTKTGKLIYEKQFMGKAEKEGLPKEQDKKDEVYQLAFEKCLESFSFDASHIHRLEN